MPRASGSFDVRRAPLPPYETAGDALMGRFSLDKTFRGDLEATSKGEMLSAGSAVKGSAGYVAMEFVRGTLHGLAGTFALQHSGTMARGVPSLVLTVVPDSGTGALAGLTGSMAIVIEAGAHHYHFDYALGAGG